MKKELNGHKTHRYGFITVCIYVSALYLVNVPADQFNTLCFASNCNKSLNDGNDFQVLGKLHKYLSIQKCRVKS